MPVSGADRFGFMPRNQRIAAVLGKLALFLDRIAWVLSADCDIVCDDFVSGLFASKSCFCRCYLFPKYCGITKNRLRQMAASQVFPNLYQKFLPATPSPCALLMPLKF